MPSANEVLCDVIYECPFLGGSLINLRGGNPGCLITAALKVLYNYSIGDLNAGLVQSWNGKNVFGCQLLKISSCIWIFRQKFQFTNTLRSGLFNGIWIQVGYSKGRTNHRAFDHSSTRIDFFIQTFTVTARKFSCKWGSEWQTNLVLEWSKIVCSLNGSLFRSWLE